MRVNIAQGGHVPVYGMKDPPGSVDRWQYCGALVIRCSGYASVLSEFQSRNTMRTVPDVPENAYTLRKSCDISLENLGH
jgi:hypothetical protein